MLGILITVGIIVIIIAIVLFIASKWLKTYNTFKTLYVGEKHAMVEIKVALKQRVQIYNNLAQVIRNYSGHEHDTFLDTAKERGGIKDGSGLSVLFERYPELKANDMHETLMGNDSITEVEARVKNAIDKHNNGVNYYNTKLKTFPTSIVGNFYNFTELDYFSFDNAEYEELSMFEEKQC